MHQIVKKWGIGLLLSCLASLSLANSEWENRLLTQLDEAATLEHQRFSFQQVSQSSKARNFAQFEPQQDPQWQLLEPPILIAYLLLVRDTLYGHFHLGTSRLWIDSPIPSRTLSIQRYSISLTPAADLSTRTLMIFRDCRCPRSLL